MSYLLNASQEKEGPTGAHPLALAAVFLVLIYSRFLREADEFQRTVQLQALALGFGGGFFTICGYSLFERAGAPAVSGPDLAVAMPLFYVLGIFLGWRRYR